VNRGAFDVLRRAFENTVANWPLILIRLAESIMLSALVSGALLAVLTPVLVSVGIDVANIDFENAEQLESAMRSLTGRWMIAVWIFLAVVLVTILFVAIHSLVEAGSARVYVDAERVAGEGEGPMSRFRVFSMERWWTGARDGFWSVFWIYNMAWGLAGMLMLIPLVPTLLMVIMFGRENPAIGIGIGCLGGGLSMLLMLFLTIFTTMWVNRAIADQAVQRQGVRASLGAARRALGADIGRHILIAIMLFLVAIAGSMFFGSFSLFAGIGEMVGRNSSAIYMATLPLRIFGTILSSAFSAAVTSWFLAAYCSLAVEARPSAASGEARPLPRR